MKMEGEIIIASVIMTISTIISIQLIQKGWETRQKIKYKYQVKRAKMSNKLKRDLTPPPTVSETIKGAGNVAGLLKNLDSDTLQDLADRFLGGSDEDLAGGSGSTLDLLMGFAEENPDVVKGLIQGLGSGSKKLKEQEQPFGQMQ